MGHPVEFISETRHTVAVSTTVILRITRGNCQGRIGRPRAVLDSIDELIEIQRTVVQRPGIDFREWVQPIQHVIRRNGLEQRSGHIEILPGGDLDIHRRPGNKFHGMPKILDQLGLVGRDQIVAMSIGLDQEFTTNDLGRLGRPESLAGNGARNR